MKKKLFISLLLIIMLLIFLREAGELLVQPDLPVKGDVLLILMGSNGERSLHAIDLYGAGYAKKIIFINPDDPDKEMLQRKGISIASDAGQLKQILTQKNIDTLHAVEVLGGPAKNTLDEAKIFAQYCTQHPEIKIVLVVTSNYHSGRASKIFKHIFRNENVKLLFPLNPYSTYHPRKWWEKRKDIELTWLEIMKTIYYLCWSKWG